MFLSSLIARNRAFLEASVQLHQDNLIPANSYVLDLDAVEANTRHMAAEAHRRRLKVYAMSKQVGRAPGALRAITDGGADGYVAVDMACARPIVANGHRLGNLGHLVQVPRAEAGEAASLAPEYWTIFSRNKALEASQAVSGGDRTQPVLLRVWDEGDVFYPGHEGGFHVDELSAAIEFVNRLDGLTFAGLTTFPALLYDAETRRVKPTPNVETLARGVEVALGRLGTGFPIEVNAPGTTSTAVLGLLAEMGATQIEPGHGLTGTTPLHAVEDLPEQPAVLYLTEIAHLHQDVPLCFGGGLYVDPVFDPYQTKVVAAGDPEEVGLEPVRIDMPDPAGIDYYARLHPPEGRRLQEGDTVIAGFRIQAFVTRSLVVGVKGVSVGNPVVSGIWNVDGAPVDWGRR
ncbi:MAG: YhfX family PLP-dependent enzyme [Acidimicrobiia bacterium]|nr:YhfX family PLP-dependent enzyme [Acidimicrobiia bacterium]MYG93020.1 YhfX family PLP-dependent enzyme [Acidimicrobiia bacterium]